MVWREPQSLMKPVAIVTESSQGLIAGGENWWYWGGKPYHSTALDLSEQAISKIIYEMMSEDDAIGADMTVEMADKIASRLRQRLRGVVEMP